MEKKEQHEGCSRKPCVLFKYAFEKFNIKVECKQRENDKTCNFCHDCTNWQFNSGGDLEYGLNGKHHANYRTDRQQYC